MRYATLDVKTSAHTQMIDITGMVAKAIKDSGVKSGICMVSVPHTTAAVTINENADPDVVRDLIMELDKVIPWTDGYHHMEGNSAAHLKSSLTGASEMVMVEDGRPVLGTWQGLYFCEFDGPRNRKLDIKIIEDNG